MKEFAFLDGKGEESFLVWGKIAKNPKKKRDSKNLKRSFERNLKRSF